VDAYRNDCKSVVLGLLIIIDAISALFDRLNYRMLKQWQLYGVLRIS
jgi:hypothetical protein